MPSWSSGFCDSECGQDVRARGRTGFLRATWDMLHAKTWAQSLSKPSLSCVVYNASKSKNEPQDLRCCKTRLTRTSPGPGSQRLHASILVPRWWEEITCMANQDLDTRHKQ